MAYDGIRLTDPEMLLALGAIAAYGELQGLIQQTGGMSGVASLKACMNILGYRGGVPRLPVQPLARQEEARLLDALIAAGKVSAV